MSIVGAFDVHRRQLTFDYLDTVTGEVNRGRVVPADREHLREWLGRFAGQHDVHFGLEGCTGWRYVTEELAAAGIIPHLAEPADTAALSIFPTDLASNVVAGLHVSRHGAPWWQILPFVGLTVLLLAVPSLMIVLLGERAKHVLPKIRNWMNQNAWVVSEIVLVS
jgi:hypothetical protein